MRVTRKELAGDKVTKLTANDVSALKFNAELGCMSLETATGKHLYRVEIPFREFEVLVGKIPFVLSCGLCDAEDNQSMDEAILKGWTEISLDLTGTTWNYIGTCLDCKDE